MNTLGAIAWNAFREVVRHPAYVLVLIGLGLFICGSYWLSDFHFEKDVTGDVLQMGIASIIDGVLFLSILASSKVLYEEIEKKTVLTILSKPVDRERFLLGKYAGILLATGLAVLLLVAVLIATVYVHHSRAVRLDESAVLRAVDLALRGAFLCLVEASILAAFAVTVSIWLPFEATAVAVSGFFFLGHMSERVRSYFEEQGWTWVGKGIYYLVPNLEDFSIDRAIATESPVSDVYLVWSAAYGLAVTAAILFVALALFRERELT